MKAALITPAYNRDGQSLALACEQLDRFCPSDIEHILVASRRNRSQFRHLESDRRRLLFVEDVIGHVWRTPIHYRRRELYFYKIYRPVDGWIMQQIVKLAAPDFCQAELFVYLDSDVFLIRPFSVADFVAGEKVRLLRKPPVDKSDHRGWNRLTERLLQLPASAMPLADYVGSFVSWRRDICLALRDRLERQWRRSWLDVLTRQKRLSEYTLYGIYVDRILAGAPDKHFATDRELCLSSWDLGGEDLVAEFRRALKPHHLAINIQSNLRLPFAQVRDTLAAVTSNVPAADWAASAPY
jgi:hypothetical protein